LDAQHLVVSVSPGFSLDLWHWSLQVAMAPSGATEVVWHTSSFEPQSKRRHRFREVPTWWQSVNAMLDQIEFSALPPTTPLGYVMDGVEQLSVERYVGASRSVFSISWSPERWPPFPGATAKVLQVLYEQLDALARKLHAT